MWLSRINSDRDLIFRQVFNNSEDIFSNFYVKWNTFDSTKWDFKWWAFVWNNTSWNVITIWNSLPSAFNKRSLRLRAKFTSAQNKAFTVWLHPWRNGGAGTNLVLAFYVTTGNNSVLWYIDWKYCQPTLPTAWLTDDSFHEIIFVYDWTQVTATDRMRIYFDWIQQTISISWWIISTSVTNSNKIIFSNGYAWWWVTVNDRSVSLIEIYNSALTPDKIIWLSDNSISRQYNPIMDLKKWIKWTGTYSEKYNYILKWQLVPNWDIINNSWWNGVWWTYSWWTAIATNAADWLYRVDMTNQLILWKTYRVEFKINSISAWGLFPRYWVTWWSWTIRTTPWVYSETFTITTLWTAGRMELRQSWNVTAVVEYFYLYEVNTYPVGKKYFICESPWTIWLQSKQAYWTWEFYIYKWSDSNQLFVNFLQNKIASEIAWVWYQFLVPNNESARIARTNWWTDNTFLASAANFLANNTWYKIKVTRTLAWFWTLYVKWWVYNDWTIAWIPTTDSTYTTSNFICLDFDSWDRISDIVFYPYITT